jgi:hypothetical protein
MQGKLLFVQNFRKHFFHGAYFTEVLQMNTAHSYESTGRA